jgi:hypothetical protein
VIQSSGPTKPVIYTKRGQRGLAQAVGITLAFRRQGDDALCDGLSDDFRLSPIVEGINCLRPSRESQRYRGQN